MRGDPSDRELDQDGYNLANWRRSGEPGDEGALAAVAPNALIRVLRGPTARYGVHPIGSALPYRNQPPARHRLDAAQRVRSGPPAHFEHLPVDPEKES